MSPQNAPRSSVTSTKPIIDDPTVFPASPTPTSNLLSTTPRLPAEHHINILDGERAGGNARDGRVVGVVGVECELQQVSAVQFSLKCD